jgi:hypothetical protein
LEIFLKTSPEEYFPTTIISTPLPSQSTLNHQPIKKKLKPGIGHDYLLLRFVGFFTKIDWSITDGFEDMPLLPSDNTLQHSGHMHSHVPINAKTNTVRREGRINAL